MPIAIIATSGNAPLDLAHTLRQQGKEPLIFVLENITTADFQDFETIDVTIGAVGGIIQELKKHQCTQLIFSGQLKRPPLNIIKPDWLGTKLLVKALAKGDDNAMCVIKDAFVKEGIDIINPASLMPENYANEGVMCGANPDDAVWSSIRLGVGVLKAASTFDVGQCAVVQDERVLSIEGAEGTDELIKRTAALVYQGAGAPVFVKMMKTNQDPSLDPPGFGTETIKHCAEANIKIVALEAGRVMMLNKADVIDDAKQQGISIVGFNVSDIPDHG